MRAKPQRWVVSAAHRRPPRLHTNEPKQPYGVAHARQVGASYTVCGVWAVGWPLFWELRFDPAQDNACPRCAEQLRATLSASAT